MVKLPGLLLLWLVTGVAMGQTTDLVKEWRVPLQHGEALARLDHGLGDRLVLSLRGPACSPCSSTTEIAGMVREVVRQMPGLGLKQQNLSIILTHIEDPEMQRKLANAAVQSAAWKTCMHRAGCGGNGTVVELLRTMGAIEPLNGVLKEFGLTAMVSSAENISVKRASKIAGLVLPVGVKGTLRVPEDADLTILVRSMRP